MLHTPRPSFFQASLLHAPSAAFPLHGSGLPTLCVPPHPPAANDAGNDTQSMNANTSAKANVFFNAIMPSFFDKYTTKAGPFQTN
jgi:hypothetical protein